MSERKVQLTVLPSVGLVDTPVRTVIDGLEPRQSVTLAAVLISDDEFSFASCGHYVADDEGKLNLDEASSYGGTYEGIEPMGFMWGMQLTPGQKKGVRIIKRDVKLPFAVSMYVLTGHTRFTDILYEVGACRFLAECVIHRYYQSPTVVDIPVSVGNIRGMLFIPPGEGPFPGVIDMFGTNGGLVMTRASLLASRGFLTLSLAYFGYQDLPEMIDLDLEYFQEAIDWLYAHPSVIRTHGIGVVGVSKGASLALYMATISPKVKAVVAINPNCFHSFGEHRYGGVQQPVVNALIEDLYETDEGLIYGKAFTYNEQRNDSIIPVERAAHSEFLFIRGEDDPSCGREHIDILTGRLRGGGLNNYEVLDYPGAGHLIEPPYAPLCRVCYTKLARMTVVYGGEPKSHAAAQENSWRELLSFFYRHLTGDGRTSDRPRMHSKL